MKYTEEDFKKEFYYKDVYRNAKNNQLIKEYLVRHNVHDLKKIEKAFNKTIILLGSGKSLDGAWKYLYNTTYEIACTTSQASTCAYYKAFPKYIFNCDPYVTWDELESNQFLEIHRSMLITSTDIDSHILEKWSNNIYLFKKEYEGKEEYSKYLDIMYSYLEVDKEGHDYYIPYLWAKIKCTYITAVAALRILKMLGYKKIYLIGFDFIKERSVWYRFDPYHAGWVEYNIPKASYDIVKYKGKKTYSFLVDQKNEILKVIQEMEDIEIINTSDISILDEIKYEKLF